jgi:hypothetical protein
MNCSNIKDPEEGKGKGLAMGDTNKRNGNKYAKNEKGGKKLNDFPFN